MRRVIIAVAVVLSGMVLIAGAPTPGYAQLDALIARVKPAVVHIETESLLPGWRFLGSGFIYDSSGYILTNHHVIEGATAITVTLQDRRTYPATVVDYMHRFTIGPGGEFEDTPDVAVLKIDATGLPVLPLGISADLHQGQDLLVLGYPGAVKSSEVSVARGIVSAVRGGWIQTDAQFDHGNSGGPTIDTQGRVVGLATFGVGTAGKIGGIVAIDAVREIAWAAKVVDGRRYQLIDYPGWDYISPANQPKRKVWLVRYNPGKTSGQPSETQVTTDVSEMREANGAFLYTLEESGGKLTVYVGVDGLAELAYSGPQSQDQLQGPLTLFPIPAAVGAQWQYRYGVRNSNGLQPIAGTARIETSDAVVTVPAGSYSNAVKIVIEEQHSVPASPSQTTQQFRTYHSLVNKWYAKGLGLVRSTVVVRETEEEWDRQLVRATAGVPWENTNQIDQ